ncbi:MAG: 30S ribosomal protein S4 [bacterium]|nr:30S ribosomal protein S4 [bacterium]
MARYTGPKGRLCRREGLNLFGRPKYAKILERKPSKPGQQQKAGGGSSKRSEYAVQLREKQRLRFMFGLSEKQFKGVCDRAISSKGLTTDNLMRELELRLDNVLYRSGLALTRMQARQLASHGHFLVNGRRVDVPSYQVRVGDKIEARPKSKKSPVFPAILEENKGVSPARWLKVDTKGLSVEVSDVPASGDFEQLVDCQKIIEYYSR